MILPGTLVQIVFDEFVLEANEHVLNAIRSRQVADMQSNHSIFDDYINIKSITVSYSLSNVLLPMYEHLLKGSLAVIVDYIRDPSETELAVYYVVYYCARGLVVSTHSRQMHQISNYLKIVEHEFTI